jgi:type VI secretion system FHA domain protein
MSLILVVIRGPDSVAFERREVTGGEFSIGRGPDNDWILADPERHLSKRHCQLAFRSGGWLLTDSSSNGTFVNHDARPVGPGAPRPLRDGDRIRLGQYELEVSVVEQERFGDARSAPPARAGGGYAGLAPDMLDPFADPAPPPQPFGAPADPLLRGPGADEGLGIRLPADFDPLGDPGDDPFRGPTQSDHAPAIDGAFRPPPPPAAAIPDDWDLDLTPTPAAPRQAPPRPAAPPPPADLDDWDIDLSPNAAEPPPPPAPLPRAPARITPAPDAPAAPPATAAPPARVPTAATAPQAAPPSVDDAELIAAFLRGVGLGEATLPDPRRTMELAGAALRATVSGIRQALIARASIKGEFRIEQTMIRTTGNNPLKFSAGDDDALAAFLGLGRRGSMVPADAVAEALRDMRLHELATVTAMQAAVRALLAQFDPGAIDVQATKGGFNVLPVQRKARAWETFEAMHEKISQALSDDFDSVFGKAFARAYEQAMRELSASGNLS